MDPEVPLTFAAVDEMAFAPSAQPMATVLLRPTYLGPLVEFAILKAQAKLGSTAINRVAQANALWSMFSTQNADMVVELGSRACYLRLTNRPVADTELTKLSIVSKRFARAAGFDDRAASQLSAALGEMLSNIVEHSEARNTGLVAFQVRDGCFEFVVADQGIGALQSLRTNERFATLTSDREALPRVLERGCSRYSEPGRGHGFDDMFRGLANHNGHLRFRSGDAAVLIDGINPGQLKPKVKKKPHLQGFVASVACTP
jgi:hypothetical protein